MVLDCLGHCSLTAALVAILMLWVIYKIFDRIWRRPRVNIPEDSRTVLITGCDSGFGRLLAKRLSGKGWCVFAGCLTQAAVDELKASHPSMIPICMDVSREDSVNSAVNLVSAELAKRKMRGLWGVVNNAGVSGRKIGPTEFLSQADFQEVFAVNVFGIVNVTRACLPLMRQLKRSRLVNTSSIFGRFATPGSAAYAASKFAVQALSDCYRRELVQFGCHVAILEPGFHRTPMTDKAALMRGLEKSFAEAPAILKDAYGNEYRGQSEKTLDDILRMCSDRLDNVVDAYEDALTAQRPRCRYMIGLDAKIFYWPMSLLPEWAGDTVSALKTPRAAKAVV